MPRRAVGAASRTGLRSVTIPIEALRGHRAKTTLRGDVKDTEIGFEVKPEVILDLLKGRRLATERVHRALQQLGKDLTEFLPKVHHVLPSRLDGRLVNPDGSPVRGAAVSLRAGRSDSRAASFGRPGRTDRWGNFCLKPEPVSIPAEGLNLVVKSEGESTEIPLRLTDLLEPKLGTLPLDRPFASRPAFSPAGSGRTFLDSIRDKLPASESDVYENPGGFASPAPPMMLGCESECARYFQSNGGIVDRRSYGVMVRLVEPSLGQREVVVSVKVRDGGQIVIPFPFGGSTVIDLPDIVAVIRSLGDIDLRDRIAIAEPVDVDKFRAQTEDEPQVVSKAVSLGLGYVVHMRQVWIPAGFSLGDLVYSLPLAPGEEQRIAVYEQAQTLGVRDSETLSMEEHQSAREQNDSSTEAVFTSALSESARGGSYSASGSVTGGAAEAFGLGMLVPAGGIPLLAGVGGGVGIGGSASGGVTENWQSGSRDFASNAAQEFHSTIARQASARRRAARTGMRLASASDREQVTTRAVANHNHSHALTMQYWEVLRHFSVSSLVDDVQLVCLVPMELIAWLPFGEPREISSTATLTRAGLLSRYAAILRYTDVLRASFAARPDLRQGLGVLAGLAGDPTMQVQSPGSLAQDVVQVKITGTFLPFEEVTVVALTRSGRRIGPVKLHGTFTPIPETYFSRDQLIAHLNGRRYADAGIELTGSLSLPDRSTRHEITGFEVRRRFHTAKYVLAVESLLGAVGEIITSTLDVRRLNELDLRVELTPAESERLFGGPWVWDVSARIGADEFASHLAGGRGSAERMADLLPVPALRLPPMLSFADVLKVESVLQHVVRNAVTYSRNVWAAVTSEERVMLLDRFTIGVAPTSGSGAGSDVPLMNCVANKVLGFYGNSMIMPFAIPPELVKSLGLTSRAIQEALLRFHRQAFMPPQTSITLPSPGVLGEAVLGCCNASEKIDLTRFWNWQDSPHSRPDDPATELPEGRFQGFTLGGAQQVSAPKDLVPTAPTNLIANVTAAAAPTNLLEQMLAAAKGGGPSLLSATDLTGAAALQAAIAADRTQAGQAYTDAMAKAESMGKAALSELGKVADAQKAQLAADKAEKTEADKADKAAKAEADKAASDARAQMLTSLSSPESLKKILGLVTASGQAEATAQALVGEMFGGASPALSMLEQAEVLSAIVPLKDAFAAAVPALLQALGIAVVL